MLHNGEFNYSQQPFPLALPISYPSSTQVYASLLDLATPWVDLGYTLATPWVDLG